MASIKSIFKSLVDAIVFSNTWISLGALSLFLSVHLIFNLPLDVFGAVALFSATFIAYNLLKLNGTRFESNNSIFFNWLRKYKYIIYVLLLLALGVFLYSFFYITFWQQTAYLLSSFLAAVYFGIDKYNLRKYSALKVPIVAVDWSILVVYSTLHFTDFTSNNLYAFLSIYFLIAGLTIPFEIRDKNADSNNINEHETLFSKLGIRKLKTLSIIHLIFAFVFFAFIDCKLLFLLPLLLVLVIFILKLKNESTEYAYTFILDGVLICFLPLIYVLYA